ncbi:MAG: glycerophosphodiester phosphodiesterase family protein [Patescibacteria group bacterium]|nr:glycerophosphodiester phosphodiesterase family protein [Patescibacteria group bacterium]
MKKDVNFLVEKPIAHRGLWSGEIAENSLIAFSHAIDAGYPIELDVQLTSDDKLVVFHDWTLERVTNGNGKLSEKKYDDIKDLALGKSKQKILLFEDFLNLVNGEVALVVEIKSQSYFNYEICERVYSLLQNYDGKYAISAFNPFIVRWFTQNAPEIVRGQNFTDFKHKNIMEGWMRRMFAYSVWIVSNNKPDFFACRARMIPKSLPVHIAQKKQKPILAYTITNKQEYDRIKDVMSNEFFDGKSYIK